jgi:hypothetical protein
MGKAPLVQSVEMIIKWSDGSEHKAHLSDVAGSWSWQQGSLPADVLGEREFGDALDSMAARVAEYNEDHAPVSHYHVGANVPSYLPDGEVQCLWDDLEDARAALVYELSRSGDLADCEHDKTVEGCDSCTLRNDVKTALSELEATDETTLSAGFCADVYDGRSLPVRYWIDVVPHGDCEISDDD